MNPFNTIEQHIYDSITQKLDSHDYKNAQSELTDNLDEFSNLSLISTLLTTLVRHTSQSATLLVTVLEKHGIESFKNPLFVCLQRVLKTKKTNPSLLPFFKNPEFLKFASQNFSCDENATEMLKFLKKMGMKNELEKTIEKFEPLKCKFLHFYEILEISDLFRKNLKCENGLSEKWRIAMKLDFFDENEFLDDLWALSDEILDYFAEKINDLTMDDLKVIRFVNSLGYKNCADMVKSNCENDVSNDQNPNIINSSNADYSNFLFTNDNLKNILDDKNESLNLIRKYRKFLNFESINAFLSLINKNGTSIKLKNGLKKYFRVLKSNLCADHFENEEDCIKINVSENFSDADDLLNDLIETKRIVRAAMLGVKLNSTDFTEDEILSVLPFSQFVFSSEVFLQLRSQIGAPEWINLCKLHPDLITKNAHVAFIQSNNFDFVHLINSVDILNKIDHENTRKIFSMLNKNMQLCVYYKVHKFVSIADLKFNLYDFLASQIIYNQCCDSINASNIPISSYDHFFINEPLFNANLLIIKILTQISQTEINTSNLYDLYSVTTNYFLNDNKNVSNVKLENTIKNVELLICGLKKTNREFWNEYKTKNLGNNEHETSFKDLRNNSFKSNLHNLKNKLDCKSNLRGDNFIEDNLQKDNLNIDSLNEVTLRKDTLNEDNLNEDNLQKDNLNEVSLNENNFQKDNLNEVSLNENNLQKDNLNEDSLNEVTLRKDNLQEYSLRKDSLQKDNSNKDNIREDNLNEYFLRKDNLNEDNLNHELVEYLKINNFNNDSEYAEFNEISKKLKKLKSKTTKLNCLNFILKSFNNEFEYNENGHDYVNLHFEYKNKFKVETMKGRKIKIDKFVEFIGEKVHFLRRLFISEGENKEFKQLFIKLNNEKNRKKFAERCKKVCENENFFMKDKELNYGLNNDEVSKTDAVSNSNDNFAICNDHVTYKINEDLENELESNLENKLKLEKDSNSILNLSTDKIESFLRKIQGYLQNGRIADLLVRSDCLPLKVIFKLDWENLSEKSRIYTENLLKEKKVSYKEVFDYTLNYSPDFYNFIYSSISNTFYNLYSLSIFEENIDKEELFKMIICGIEECKNFQILFLNAVHLTRNVNFQIFMEKHLNLVNVDEIVNLELFKFNFPGFVRNFDKKAGETVLKNDDFDVLKLINLFEEESKLKVEGVKVQLIKGNKCLTVKFAYEAEITVSGSIEYSKGVSFATSFLPKSRITLKISDLLRRTYKFMEVLSVYKVEIDRKISGLTECVICYLIDDIVPDLKCKVCTAVYHKKCFYRWADKAKNMDCVVCKNLIR